MIKLSSSNMFWAMYSFSWIFSFAGLVSSAFIIFFSVVATGVMGSEIDEKFPQIKEEILKKLKSL